MTEQSGWLVLSFGERLEAVFAGSGHLCLNIDPHPYLLDEWDLPQSAAGVREFGMRAVDAAAGVVGIVKPQVAFFERFGSAGYLALEATLTAARDSGLLVIADAKRGDIGSSVAAYGEAWLVPGSPLEADALTVSAYQGIGSLLGVVAMAIANGKGLFMLAATSNPESTETQAAVRDRGAFAGRTVAASILEEVEQLNLGGTGLGSIGVVIGATANFDVYGIAAGGVIRTPILAPGFGEQGAEITDIANIYGTAAPNVVASVGRAVLFGSPSTLGARLSLETIRLATSLRP